MRLRLVFAVLVAVGVLAVAAPSPVLARSSSRYFEVQVNASGGLSSGPTCSVNVPCSGDYLTTHYMFWHWIAYALVVAQQTGRHTTLHLIGPRPRVAAYFNEKVSWSQRDDCVEDYSTGHGEYLDRFMTTPLSFRDADGVLSVNAGAPLNSHFSMCGSGTVSLHGRDGARASWDGLAGPWNYNRVHGPTRGQIRSKALFVHTAYSTAVGIEHKTGGWQHTSARSSALVITFTRFAGGKRNVFAYERSFAKRHPATSHGFTKYG